MPLTVVTKFMTENRKDDEPQIVAELKRLTSPADETCTVVIGERQMDADIHVTLRRRRKTLLWSDGWTISEGETADTYKYEKAFRGNPSVMELADSVRRMLEAPEDTSR